MWVNCLYDTAKFELYMLHSFRISREMNLPMCIHQTDRHGSNFIMVMFLLLKYGNLKKSSSRLNFNKYTFKLKQKCKINKCPMFW